MTDPQSKPHRQDLTTSEIVALCPEHGIHMDIPYSQLEAEAVRRGVALEAICTVHLLTKLVEAGVVA